MSMEEPQSQIDAFAEFWARVKEHKVLQWTLAYLAAALALAHGAELLSQAFDWPHIIFRIFVGLLALGLPVAVTLSWYHGHRGAHRVSGAELTIIALLLFIGAGLFFIFVRPSAEHTETPTIEAQAPPQSAVTPAPPVLARPAPAPTAAAPAEAPASAQVPAPMRLASAAGKPRIAILPFENLSPDPANAFFTDGMHEEITSALANAAPGLEVISRTTMMSYKDKPVTVEEVAKDLGVTHVLEGSVRRERDHVRLTLQLIDAGTDGHIWSQNYDRKLVSAMTLQSEVASEVASQLSVKLAGVAQTAPTTKDPVAYDYYLKARLARENLNGSFPASAWHNVEGLLGQALSRDPDFVLALIERANVNLWLFMVGHDTSGETLDLARADLDKAMRLAPDAPAVIAAQGLWAYAQLDFDEALKLLNEAEAAGLNDPDLLIWKSAVLDQSGRHDEAAKLQDRLLSLDPGNPYLIAILIFGPLNAHQPAEAVRLADLALARAPNSAFWQSMRDTVIWGYTGTEEAAARWWARYEAEIKQLGPSTLNDIGAKLGATVDDIMLVGHYDEARKLIDAANEESERAVRIEHLVLIGMGRMPLAEPRGWADLLLGDKASAATDGRKVLDFVANEKPTKWNDWLLRQLSADAHLFTGDRLEAVKQSREALAMATKSPNFMARAAAKFMAARTLAWAGAGDEAVRLLSELTTSAPGISPATAARSPYFTVSLADHPGYQALKVKLDAQMAATKLE